MMQTEQATSVIFFNPKAFGALRSAYI